MRTSRPWPSLNLRSPARADAAAVAALGRAAWEARIAPLVGRRAATALRALAPFERILDEAGRPALVAELNGRIAGFALADPAAAYVADLWVGPDFEGRGVGSALLRAMERLLAERGVGEAQLVTLAANLRARAFFGRTGWRASWRGERYDRAHDAVLAKTGMSKTLFPRRPAAARARLLRPASP